jgi:oligoribonuclease NrnB/cAMP/cGMP phosphodiesterase (DHH superfamily)
MNKTRTVCFYHGSDLDGKASASICLRKYPGSYLRPINYGFKSFDWKDIDENTRVIVVDFCFEPWTMMEKMIKKAKDFIWIDHHQTSLDEHNTHHKSSPIKGNRTIGTAACVLTWKHFFPEEPLPEGIRLLGEYDVWRLEDPRVMSFQCGMKSISHEPGSDIWGALFGPDCISSDRIQNLIHDGEGILRYQRIQNSLYVRMLSFVTNLIVGEQSYRAIACNAALNNSQLFDSIWDGEKYDLMLSFHRRSDAQWSVSLYTKHDDVDVGAIAKTFSGGGHQKASGFTCDKLPFQF